MKKIAERFRVSIQFRKLRTERLLPEGSTQRFEKVTGIFLSRNQQKGGIKFGASIKRASAKREGMNEKKRLLAAVSSCCIALKRNISSKSHQAHPFGGIAQPFSTRVLGIG